MAALDGGMLGEAWLKHHEYFPGYQDGGDFPALHFCGSVGPQETVKHHCVKVAPEKWAQMLAAAGGQDSSSYPKTKQRRKT